MQGNIIFLNTQTIVVIIIILRFTSTHPPVHESASVFYPRPIILPLKNDIKLKNLEEIIVTRPQSQDANAQFRKKCYST